ncbi:MAG: hypothetical protein AB2807_04115, partial [Candidatus Sedimenticola endophacoides]
PKSTRQRDSRYCPDRPALITTPSRTLQQRSLTAFASLSMAVSERTQRGGGLYPERAGLPSFGALRRTPGLQGINRIATASSPSAAWNGSQTAISPTAAKASPM